MLLEWAGLKWAGFHVTRQIDNVLPNGPLDYQAGGAVTEASVSSTPTGGRTSNEDCTIPV